MTKGTLSVLNCTFFQETMSDVHPHKIQKEKKLSLFYEPYYEIKQIYNKNFFFTCNLTLYYLFYKIFSLYFIYFYVNVFKTFLNF